MFTKLWETLRKYKTRSEESGSAIIFALVLMIVTFGLVNVVTAFGLNNLNKALFVQSYTNNGLAAETAINNALLVANSPNSVSVLNAARATSPTAPNAIKGTISATNTEGIGALKWSWYTERVPGANPLKEYYVHAYGYIDTPNDPYARHFRIKMKSMANVTAIYDTGLNQITYKPQTNAVSQWGIMGSSSVALYNGVNIDSYISDEVTNPTSNSTERAEIASNGNFAIKGTNAVNILNMLNYSETTANNRCNISLYPACTSYNPNPISYRTDLTAIDETVRAQCPAQTYPVWRASENGGILRPNPATPGKYCYNSLIFDQNTTLETSVTTTNPAKVYIKGDITVLPNIQVNMNKSPLTLRIYSEGGKLADFRQGNVTVPTRISAYIAGSVLKCTDNTLLSSIPQGMKLYIYGSLACDVISMGGGTQIWWDELSVDLAGTGADVRRLWSADSYEEIY